MRGDRQLAHARSTPDAAQIIVRMRAARWIGCIALALVVLTVVNTLLVVYVSYTTILEHSRR